MKECIRVLKEFHSSTGSAPPSDNLDDLALAMGTDSGLELMVQPVDGEDRLLLACILPPQSSLEQNDARALLQQSRILTLDQETSIGQDPETGQATLVRTLHARFATGASLTQACEDILSLAENLCRNEQQKQKNDSPESQQAEKNQEQNEAAPEVGRHMPGLGFA